MEKYCSFFGHSDYRDDEHKEDESCNNLQFLIIYYYFSQTLNETPVNSN